MSKIPPTIKVWEGMKIVKVSTVGEGFRKWLGGQTVPLVESDPAPYDWAYYWDYENFISKHNPAPFD